MKKYSIEESIINSNQYILEKEKVLTTYILMCEVNLKDDDMIKEVLTYELVKYTININHDTYAYSYIIGFLDYISDIREYSIINFIKKVYNNIDFFLKKCNVTDIVCKNLYNNKKITLINNCNLYLYNIFLVLNKYFDETYIYEIFYDIKEDIEITLYELEDSNNINYLDIIKKIKLNNYTLLKEIVSSEMFNSNIRSILCLLNEKEQNILKVCIYNEVVGFNEKSLNNISIHEISKLFEQSYLKSYLNLKKIRNNFNDKSNLKVYAKRKQNWY